MTKIKVLCQTRRRSAEPFEYSPGFVFTTDPNCLDYDWLVAYDDIHKDCETLVCPPERTILLTGEPTSIKCYSRAYARQFGHLLTNRPFEAERHPHYHLGRGYYFWFVGRSYRDCCRPVLTSKDRLVSACISAKQMRHTRHHDRFELIKALAGSVPGLDWFGRGVRSFGQKYEVLDGYKYHVAVENHIAPHHWSEKIADAFLCECLPFYAGDPMLSEVFPSESFIPIPIDDPAEAVRIVKAAIAEGAYEKRREAILEAKRLVLTKFNFWAQVIRVIEAERDQVVAKRDPACPAKLYPRHTIRWRNPLAAIECGLFHLRQYCGLRHIAV